MDNQGGTDRDVIARIEKARVAFFMRKNMWISKEIRTSTKIRIFNSNVKSVRLYVSDTLGKIEGTQRKIQTFAKNF